MSDLEAKLRRLDKSESAISEALVAWSGFVDRVF